MNFPTSIELLADYPHWIPEIARWHWEEWGHYDPTGSLAAWTEGLARRTGRDTIPLTLVAVQNDEPVASASLVVHDMDTRKDLSPWLAGVYVLPARRSQGIGARLVRAAMARAQSLGISTLYLYTRSAVGLYSKQSWQPLETCFYQGRQVVIMIADL